MARLFANENLPEPVVLELRRLGRDVLTMRESGHAGRAVPDSDVLEFATGERRAVLTLNRRHFVRQHHHRSGHGGIVVCTFDLDFAALAHRIHSTLRAAIPPTGPEPSCSRNGEARSGTETLF